jgi:hypothetical protein
MMRSAATWPTHWLGSTLLITRGTVLVIHAFKKTTQQTSARNLELVRMRLKEVRP